MTDYNGNTILHEMCRSTKFSKPYPRSIECSNAWIYYRSLSPTSSEISAIKLPIEMAMSDLNLPNCLFKIIASYLGVWINQRNQKGQTPLHVAAEEWNKAIISNLLAIATTEIDAQDKEGNTSLNLLLKVEEGCIRMLNKKSFSFIGKEFISRGANLHLCNKDGLCPLDYLEKYNPLFKVLREKGTDITESTRYMTILQLTQAELQQALNNNYSARYGDTCCVIL